MRYLGRCALLGIALFSCTPSLDNTPPPDLVTARFDPSIPDVPTPTDLVRNPTTGLLQIPDGGNLSPTELEFIGYLNTLNGYPPDTPATANFDSALNPSTVTAADVQVVDITSPTAPRPVTLTRRYADIGTPPKGQITMIPPTGWTSGHRYMVALIAGANGLQGVGGRQVVGSAAWALISSPSPLISCPNNNLADPGCRLTTDLIPSRETDPAKRLADQLATARQLETLRLAFAQLIGALVAQGVNRNDIVLLWTFTILSRPQMTFDPANQVIPFPNNLAALPLPDGGLRINLPIPDGGSPLQVQLLAGLNTLDGFSTSAPIVSNNSDTLAALTQGTLDPATVADGGTGVLNLNPAGIQPQIRPCLTDVPNANCLVSSFLDGGMPNNPERLQLIPASAVDGGTVPLLERSNYIAYFTDKLKDQDGGTVAASSAWALMRNRNPLLDSSGNSTVSTVPTALAQQLEPARLSMKQALDALEQLKGITREQLVLATVFRTQSEATTLRLLRTIAAPANPVFLFQQSATTFLGEIIVPNLLTGPGGVFNPSSPRAETIPFVLFVPNTAPPTGAWPVTIYGHGLTRSRMDTIAIAPRFVAGGQAMIAIDTVWHGDRAICTGSAGFLSSGSGPCGVVPGATDDDACANSTTQYCCKDANCPLLASAAGRCVPHDLTARMACNPGMMGDLFCSNNAQGRCLAVDNKCEGGTFRVETAPTGTPCVSGQNILNLTNLFATRDNFRQGVIDLTQLARVIQATGPGSLNALLGALTTPEALDPNRINYTGQSLGGILGALYTQVAPEIQNVVLNVPGSDLSTILLTSPAFRAARDAFLATLAAQNPPIVPGTPQFDDFIGLSKWILDPADPINAGFGVLNGTGIPATRHALIEYISFDQVIPNPTTLELINAATQTVPGGRQVDVCLFDPPLCCDNPPLCTLPQPRTNCASNSVPPEDRHGFLLNFSPPNGRDAVTTRAQTQVLNYLTNPAQPTCPVQ